MFIGRSAGLLNIDRSGYSWVLCACQAANSERSFECWFSSASQDFLPDIGNIRSDNLRVVAGVKNRSGNSDTYLPSQCIIKSWTYSPSFFGLKVRTHSRGDINSAFRRYLINHERRESGVTTRHAGKSSKRYRKPVHRTGYHIDLRCYCRGEDER